MRPGPTKIRLFSTSTPIQPGVLTMVDLGDTGGAFAPLMPAQPVQSDEDKHHIPPAINSQDVVDLRSLGFKKGDEVDEQQTQREESVGPQNQASGAFAASSLNQSVVIKSPTMPTALGSIVSDLGLKVSCHSVGIKRTGIATRWYSVCNTSAIKQPPVLHSSTALEVGDLFLNKYFSASREKDVLQVWLLMASKDSGYCWTQVSQASEISDETTHPKLPDFVLSFQPSDISAPSWVRRVTERRRRERPQIVGPGQESFAIEGTSRS